MTTSKYACAWEMMKKYKLEFVNDVEPDFKCILCKHVLKNARNNICGCRYCCECISNYINTGQTYCPGSTEDCKLQKINYQTGIQVDHVINKKILNLAVKCPVEMCRFQTEVWALIDHEKYHESEFNSLEHVNKENVYEDLESCEKLSILHNQNYKSAASNKDSDLQPNQIDLWNMSKKVEELQLLSSHQNKAITRFQQIYERLIFDIHKLQEENAKTNIFIKSLFENNVANLSLQDSIKIENIKKSKTEKNPLVKNIENENLGCKNGESNCLRMRWPITNFSIKKQRAKNGKETQILSQKFYSYKKGYRMCLSVWPNGAGNGENNHISVGVYLMKGKYDMKLCWPMKHEMSIGLVDQSTNRIYLHSTYKYDFAKEIEKERYLKPSKKNSPIGTCRFIDFDLLNNAKFLLSDRIILEFCMKTN